MVKINFFLVIFILKVMLFCIFKKKLLMIFFMIELMMVNMIMSFMSLMKVGKDLLAFMVFLALAASEASMGLTLLMSMVRSWGEDKVKFLN